MGTLRLTLDGKPLGSYPLVALHDVAVAGIFGRGWDSIRLFFGR
jgi:D-alanyl-D-alanine carboxypeptidase/D-alanyl-D-alanine carboxypeptidase (penicillin-binding protein 5/6)